jgi:hypothetical protein
MRRIVLSASILLLLGSCILPRYGNFDGSSRPQPAGKGCRELARMPCAAATCGPGQDMVVVQCGILGAPITQCQLNSRCGVVEGRGH